MRLKFCDKTTNEQGDSRSWIYAQTRTRIMMLRWSQFEVWNSNLFCSKLCWSWPFWQQIWRLQLPVWFLQQRTALIPKPKQMQTNCKLYTILYRFSCQFMTRSDDDGGKVSPSKGAAWLMRLQLMMSTTSSWFWKISFSSQLARGPHQYQPEADLERTQFALRHNLTWL